MGELEEGDEQVIRLQRFQYTIRQQAEELIKRFLENGDFREQLLGCLKAVNTLCPLESAYIVKK